MPLKTPSTSPKSGGKPTGKVVTSAHGKDKTAPQKKKSAHPSQPAPAPVQISWWSNLSAERKLDVIGAVMALVGLLAILVLVSAQQSNLTSGMVRVMSQFLGWGVYVLPAGLILMGLWLILRRIEKLPPLSLERATGLILFFLWLLTAMHSFIVEPALASEAAMAGWGGGLIGSFFEIILFNSLGALGTIIVLLSWLLITLTMIFDVSVQDLFRWIKPIITYFREWIAKQFPKTTKTISLENPEVTSNGFTPLHRPEPVVLNEAPSKLVTTTKPAETVIQWKLPDVKQILDLGTAPSVNEEFIQQRGKLIQETLAAFGAPVQVVEINRGPTITQFGVEPLFVETRAGRTKVRVNKIAVSG